MKTKYLLITAVSFGIFSMYGCTRSTGEEILGSEGTGSNALDAISENQNFGNYIDQIEAGELSNEEINALQFMREEEKIARDVYINLYEQWGLLPFKNISKSEQAHMDAVLGLLNRYGLEDPAAGNEVGEFTNQDLQALYDQLIERGSKSAVEALKVGAYIEEVDIVDIQHLLNESVDNEDIEFVFSNLKRGSTFHLKAFVRNLKRYNISYRPEVLEDSLFDDIVN